MQSTAQLIALDFSKSKNKHNFYGFMPENNLMLGYRLPDAEYSALVLTPSNMDDTRRKTHLLHVHAIGRGYKKRRILRDIFYEGSKRWGQYWEDIDDLQPNPYYVHGIEPGSYVFLKTPFFRENGHWFYLSEALLHMEDFAWISEMHPEDRRRDQIRIDGKTEDVVLLRLYLVCASEAVATVELEEGETAPQLMHRIWRGDLMSAQ